MNDNGESLEISKDSEPIQNGDMQTTESLSPQVSCESEAPRLSKRQERKMRKKSQWLAKLPEKRAKEREKVKLKRQAARENNIILPSRKRLKQSTMANSTCKTSVAIDLSFDDLMNPKDLGKCVKQLMRCYTVNRRASNPMQLYFTSFNGKSEQEISKNNGYSNWDVHFEKKDYIDVFPKDDIVYLSSESDNVITQLDDSKIYIIGGLVDHNAHKDLCHRLAKEKNIAHAQLPISEFLELKTRKVLAINHVFEILLGVSEGLSWRESFLKVIPSRKGAISKEESGSETADTVQHEVTDSRKSDCESDNSQTTNSPEIIRVLETVGEGLVPNKGCVIGTKSEDEGNENSDIKQT